MSLKIAKGIYDVSGHSATKQRVFYVSLISVDFSFPRNMLLGSLFFGSPGTTLKDKSVIYTINVKYNLANCQRLIVASFHVFDIRNNSKGVVGRATVNL